MDKMLYIAMSGAKQNLEALAVHSNNLANSKTDGFRADMEQARAMQAFGEGLPSRVFAMTESPAADFRPGPIKTTGKDLDIAIRDKGWIAVQDKDGKEAYTRTGSLKYDADGILQNEHGNPILDDSGAPLVLPLPIEKVSISQDGIVSVRPLGAAADVVDEIGTIKLVNPDNNTLMRGEDGLFRLMSGANAPQDPTVSVEPGALEGSNVNAVGEMVALINLQRHFDLQVKLMSKAEENDKASAVLLNK